jgi:hypothetical protein
LNDIIFIVALTYFFPFEISSGLAAAHWQQWFGGGVFLTV